MVAPGAPGEGDSGGHHLVVRVNGERSFDHHEDHHHHISSGSSSSSSASHYHHADLKQIRILII